MNKETFVPQEESMRFRLDKVVEAVSEGILGEMLKQDKKRRDSRNRLQHLQVTTETSKAYEYYWRLLKEYEKMPLKKQLESVLELFVDISCRFDPPLYSEEVWTYTDELLSNSCDEERKEDPPFSSISFVDPESDELLAKAKMLFIYREIRNHIYYLVKMVRSNQIENKMKTENNKQKPRKGNKKGKFAEAVDKMKNGTINYNDYLPPEDEYYGVVDFDWDNMPDDVDMGTVVVRKRPPLATLHIEVETYLSHAEEILRNQMNNKQRYEALGRLYDLIDKRSDDCLVYSVCQDDDENSYRLAVELGLVVSYDKSKKKGVLKDYLRTVRDLTAQEDDAAYFGGKAEFVDGWSWEPIDGIYPALVILAWLLVAIRTEMRNLHQLWELLTGESIPKHKFRYRVPVMPDEHVENGPDIEYQYITDDYDEKKLHPFWEVEDKVVDGSGNDKSAKTVLPTQETSPRDKRKKKTIDHIEISEDKAKCLYNSLFEMEWLVDPLIEDEFVKRLTANPPDKKIKLKERIQVKCIATHYIYPKVNPKKGRKRENLKPEETAIIKKVFDCENTSMDKLNKSEDEPKNFRTFDSLMRKNGWKSKK